MTANSENISWFNQSHRFIKTMSISRFIKTRSMFRFIEIISYRYQVSVSIYRDHDSNLLKPSQCHLT